jgi:hypothetical protein
MVQERKMIDKSVVWKNASSLLALVVLASWVAPAVSLAVTNPPQQVVWQFLNRSIGKSTAYRVMQPVEDPDVPGGWIVDIKVAAPSKREGLATILTDHMKECKDPLTSPCKFYGDTNDVLIRVVDSNGIQQFPVPIAGDTKDEQIATLRTMVNSVFLKNPGWVGSFPQNETGTNPGRKVGLYLLFQRSLIQIDINAETTFKGLETFLPQELFNLFLKTSVPVDGNDVLNGAIDIFTDTQ